MAGPQDLGLPSEGVRARPGDTDLSEAGVTKLFMAAEEFTEDLADQAQIVALCVVARIDHNELRRRAGLGGIVPDRPPPDQQHDVRTHRPPGARTIR